MKLQSEKGWARWVDEAFSKLDINGDGFISMEEIMDKLPLETTDPDDDMESERFLQVILPTASPYMPKLACDVSESPSKHFLHISACQHRD